MKFVLFIAMVFSIQTAWSSEPCGGASGHRHPNGRGFVADTASVGSNAYIGQFASVCGHAQVFGTAQVFGYATVSGSALISGNAFISGNALVGGNARVRGDAWVYDDARVLGSALVFGNAKVSGYACINKGIFKGLDNITNDRCIDDSRSVTPTIVKDGARDGDSVEVFQNSITSTQKKSGGRVVIQ